MRRAKEANAVFYGIRTTADNGLHRGCSTPYRSVIHIKICRIYISCPEFAIRARFPMICIVFKRRRGVPGTFRSVADIVRRAGETHAVVYRGPAAAESGLRRSRSAPGRGRAVVDIAFRYINQARPEFAIRARFPMICIVFKRRRGVPGTFRSVADIVRRAGETHAVVYRGPAAAESGLRRSRSAPGRGRAVVDIAFRYINQARPEFAIRARFPMICIVFKPRAGAPGTSRSVADIVR